MWGACLQCPQLPLWLWVTLRSPPEPLLGSVVSLTSPRSTASQRYGRGRPTHGATHSQHVGAQRGAPAVGLRLLPRPRSAQRPRASCAAPGQPLPSLLPSVHAFPHSKLSLPFPGGKSCELCVLRSPSSPPRPCTHSRGFIFMHCDA